MVRRPAPPLLYDLWNDPFSLTSIHEERPDLVEKYTNYLEAKWQEHQALAEQFTRTADVPVTPRQLESLQTLGYIQ
jgi:DNA replicative helicase MCM subunit Mcm2 (Cdc46/Mcm family)